MGAASGQGDVEPFPGRRKDNESLRSWSSLTEFDRIRVGESASEFDRGAPYKEKLPKDWLAQWDSGEALKLKA